MTTATLGLFAGSTFRRVRKAEVVAQPFVKPDGLETCLACWKSWMAGDPDRDLGMKTMRGLVGNDDTKRDLYEAQQEADDRIGAATDAMISSLSRIHKWAIYRSCSIASVWNFPNASIVEVADEAKRELLQKLRRNSCTAILF